MPKEEQTKIGKIVNRHKAGTLNEIVWIEEYNKDGIIIYSDDVFGKVKITKGKATAIDTDVAAVDGIVAFSDYMTGGVGGLVPYVPYVKKER